MHAPPRAPRLVLPERLLRRLASVVALLAMVVPTLLGGLPFVWCAPMERAQLECCCPDDHVEAASDAPPVSVSEAHCCEGRRVQSLPTSLPTLHVDAAVEPPRLVAAVSPPAPTTASRVPEDVATRRRAHPPRAGPQPSLYARHCRYLI